MFDRSIRTEIVINAPASDVYNALTDFPAYESWHNPFIVSAEGPQPVKAGDKLKIKAQAPGSKPMEFKPTVLKAEPSDELRWKGSLAVPGLFHGEHFFLLKEEDNGSGSTLLVHGEHFSGLLIPLMGGVLAKTEEGFKAMNEALKNHLESKK